MKTPNEPYLHPWEWRDRAIRAEKQASDALDCLRKMADCKSIPEPWRSVAQCAYLGCGGKNVWMIGSVPIHVAVDPKMPAGMMHFSCGPEPEQNVTVIGLDNSAGPAT